jgi:DinB superfamily/SCP-2 sterol transfer family
MTGTRAATAPMALLADLEDLWRCLDELFASLATDDWLRRHGTHWTFADVPYHLGYFDRDIVAYPIERGADLPTAEQWVARSNSELNAWNECMFARRPPNQTVAQSLAQMQASRDAIRRVVGRMQDMDFDRPVWFPLLVGGWVPTHAVLEECRLHAWSQFMELRLRHPARSQRPLPVPRAATTHGALGDLIGFFPVLLNRVQAEQISLTLAMVFSGPGGGAWTVSVANGTCTVSEGQATQADLIMTQSPESFMKTRLELHDPLAAMQSGEIAVQGIEHMGAFAALFPHQG